MNLGLHQTLIAYNLELQTDDFLKEADDEIHNKRLIVAIVPPENGSIIEPREPFEHLIVIIPDLRRQVWGVDDVDGHFRRGIYAYHCYRFWCNRTGAASSKETQ